MFKTTDGGQTFENLIGARDVNAVHITGSNISVVHMAGDDRHDLRPVILKSSDLGKSWKSNMISDKAGDLFFMSHSSINPDIIYSIGNHKNNKLYNAVVHVSRDCGESWKETFIAPPKYIGMSIIADPSMPGHAYASIAFSLIKTEDYGKSWKVVLEKEFLRMFFTDNGILLGRHRGDILCTRDGSKSWEEVITTKGKGYITDIRYDATREYLYYGTMKGLYRMKFR